MLRANLQKWFIPILLFTLTFNVGLKSSLAQNSSSVLYVPLIGITSVPYPLSLPNGTGYVTYHYAVKNFLSELSLINVKVKDDKCGPVKFVTGDDNGDSKLDYSETWRYACTSKLTRTTQNTAIATGTANNITATHIAYSTVIVGSINTAPLISIVDVTKVTYPLSLSADRDNITFTYRVNNPGAVALSGVTLTADKCSAMSGKLGDTNGNNLLDTNEVWIYTCSTNLTQTTTNTVNVTAYANALKAVDEAKTTIKVDIPIASSSALFDVLISPLGVNSDLKSIVWEALSAVLMGLVTYSFLTRKKTFEKIQNKRKLSRRR